MGSKPAASIIIPTFKRPNYLREAIQSALLQTVACEVVVVAHGANAATLEVLEEFSGKILPITLEKDFGPHFSWLHGVLASSGDFIKFLFDDDLMDKSFVEKSLSLMSEKVGFVFSVARLIDDKGREIPEGELYRGMVKNEGVWDIYPSFRGKERSLISPGAILVRKSDAIDALFQGSLPFEEHSYFGVGPDHFLKLVCLLRYRQFGFINEPLVSFRAHDESITVASQLNSVTRSAFHFAYLEPYLHYRMLRFGRPYLWALRAWEHQKYSSKETLKAWLARVRNL